MYLFTLLQYFNYSKLTLSFRLLFQLGSTNFNESTNFQFQKQQQNGRRMLIALQIVCQLLLTLENSGAIESVTRSASKQWRRNEKREKMKTKTWSRQQSRRVNKWHYTVTDTSTHTLTHLHTYIHTVILSHLQRWQPHWRHSKDNEWKRIN